MLEPKGLAEGSFTKVAIADDEIAAVIDALPGRLDAPATWRLVVDQAGHADPAMRARVVAAAGRHLATGALGDKDTDEAMSVLRRAASDQDGTIREAVLLATLALPEGLGRTDGVAGIVGDLLASGDAGRVVSLFLMGPGGNGTEGWSVDQLKSWGSAAAPLSTLARATLFARGKDSPSERALRKMLSSGSAAQRLAVSVCAGDALGDSVSGQWSSLSLEDKRTWGPSFVRNGGAGRGRLASLALADKDAVLTQSVASALALPRRGDDAAYEPALRSGLAALDPATRAAAARAVVVRGAATLSSDVERLFAQGQDRVMTEALRATLRHGSAGWGALLSAGLKADTGHIRELAVDAVAASCRPEDRERMLGLLGDADPHVAVRAASALYLSVGQSTD